MPCHVPSATVPKGRASTLHRKPPSIAAIIDLAKPTERAAHELLLRFCTGRWPIWRLLGVRRGDGALYAAVEWLRTREPARFALAELSLREEAICWRSYTTATDALIALSTMDHAEPADTPAGVESAA